MNEVLTRLDDFRSASRPPSSRLHISFETPNPMCGFLTAAAITLAVCNTPHNASAYSPTGNVISSDEQRSNYQSSPAAFTRKSVELKIEEFSRAWNEAVELSETMVAGDEGTPLNVQTWTYAAQTLIPLVSALELPSPLMLPLQNGGLGVEWHEKGLNIELRFRNPYQVYVVLEDAHGIVPTLHDFDPNLVKARVAFHELATRKVA